MISHSIIQRSHSNLQRLYRDPTVNPTVIYKDYTEIIQRLYRDYTGIFLDYTENIIQKKFIQLKQWGWYGGGANTEGGITPAAETVVMLGLVKII